MVNTGNYLAFKNLGIDTQQELVVFLPRSSHICKSEGFQALSRVIVTYSGMEIFATLNITNDGLLAPGELSLSSSAAKKLGLEGGEMIAIGHFEPVESMSQVRAKIFGNHLTQEAYTNIVRDIVNEKYSNIFLSAFITACSGNSMSVEETCYLTQAMIDTGNRLKWGKPIVADKHSVGGLPGNRTTMIVVPIVASLGITIPKTSSRAITSPAGTADTMEVLAPVNLNLTQIEKVVEKENGCIAWGGAIQLSPADDIIVRVERALDIDSEPQMIASILSKKAAAGATYCVVDVPVGTTAKVRSKESAQNLKYNLLRVAEYIGMNISVIFSDGSQPVGNGIGPALEARDVLSILRNETTAPADLRDKSLTLSAHIIATALNVTYEKAYDMARAELQNGRAYQKMVAICKAQGAFREPKIAKYQKAVIAERDGYITDIDNRRIARVAKLAGAPDVKEAGLDLHVHLGQKVTKGDPLFSIHSNAEGELEYAYDYYKSCMAHTIRIT